MQSICNNRENQPLHAKKCKPNAMKLAPIAEVQPIFYKDTIFLRKSWRIHQFICFYGVIFTSIICFSKKKPYFCILNNKKQEIWRNNL